MTEPSPAQRVELIPIDRISVLNPRVRNERTFKDIVNNIAHVGLKKPITVTRRSEADDSHYDLVCGQGRLEAYKALGQSEVPALVVAADAEDCLIASLVENCARRQHRALDLLQDIRGMQQRGYSCQEIARKTDLSAEYVNGVARLLEGGEQRLLRSVEKGAIPLSVAVDIAEAGDGDVQDALTNAYERGLLKGRALLTAKRLIEVRRRRGKGLRSSAEPGRRRVSADDLVRAYQEETSRKQMMIRRTEATRNRLLFVTEAMRRLARDEVFLALVEDEDLATMPEGIAKRLRESSDT